MRLAKRRDVITLTYTEPDKGHDEVELAHPLYSSSSVNTLR